jgi:predicted metal-binding membrane protein
MSLAFLALREIACGRFWPMLAASLAGWALATGLDHTILLPILCTPDGHWTGGSTLVAAISVNDWVKQALSWFAMLLAMMTPVIWQPLSHLWSRSLAQRRWRAATLFCCGYFTVWMAAVAILTLGAVGLRVLSGGPLQSFAIAGIIALLWQATALKLKFRRRCHVLPPLPAFGWGAEAASLRFGAQIGGACVGTCWAIMLVPLTAEAAHTPLMLVAAVLMLAERYSEPRRFDVTRYVPVFGSLLPRRAA